MAALQDSHLSYWSVGGCVNLMKLDGIETVCFGSSCQRLTIQPTIIIIIFILLVFFQSIFFINFSQSQLMLQRNDTSSNVHVTYSETPVYTGHTFCSLAVLLFVCSSCFLSPFLCWSRRSLSLDKASSSFLPWSTSNTAKRSVIKTLKKQPNYTQTQKLWRSGTAIVTIVARLLYGKNTIMHALKHSIIDWHS